MSPKHLQQSGWQNRTPCISRWYLNSTVGLRLISKYTLNSSALWTVSLTQVALAGQDGALSTRRLLCRRETPEVKGGLGSSTTTILKSSVWSCPATRWVMAESRNSLHWECPKAGWSRQGHSEDLCTKWEGSKASFPYNCWASICPHLQLQLM